MGTIIKGIIKADVSFEIELNHDEEEMTDDQIQERVGLIPVNEIEIGLNEALDNIGELGEIYSLSFTGNNGIDITYSVEKDQEICNVCHNPISDENDGVECDKCNAYFHIEHIALNGICPVCKKEMSDIDTNV
jgi:hypothetical protein